jgi:hypothetical protein
MPKQNPPGAWPGGLFLSGVKKVVFQELALEAVIQEIAIMEPLVIACDGFFTKVISEIKNGLATDLHE